MKKQFTFTIKSVNSLKAITKPVAKSEATTLFGFFGMKSSCAIVNPDFTGVSKPVFSL